MIISNKDSWHGVAIIEYPSPYATGWRQRRQKGAPQGHKLKLWTLPRSVSVPGVVRILNEAYTHFPPLD
jgi:hypothetical protein